MGLAIDTSGIVVIEGTSALVPATSFALSPYRLAEREMRELGFHPIPIPSGEKGPRINKWERFCDVQCRPGYTLDPTLVPADANIGLCMGSRCGEYIVVAIDIDADDAATIERIKGALPTSPMRKFGRKGETMFFLASPDTASAQFRRDDDTVLVDLLAHRKQTVVPGSIHPDTGRPYQWLAGPVEASKLPIIDEDIWTRFHEALEACGWNGGLELPCNDAPAFHGDVECDDGSPYAETNEYALAHLDNWVPSLGLHGIKATGSRYMAVATWRSSSSGQDLDRRKRNLSIHPSGIFDFGAQRGYSPIDLVMEARAVDHKVAHSWLYAACGLKADIERHFSKEAEEKMIANAERRCLEQEATAPSVVTVEQTCHFAAPASPLTWDDREANAALELDWLVKGLFLRVGVHLLWGQSASGKSFVTLELARCIATGEGFFDHRVKKTGGVLFALGEGAGSMTRRINALRIGKLQDSRPVDPVTGEMIDIDRLPFVWMPVGGLSEDVRFREFAANVRAAAREMPERHGCPLRLVFIDTVVASFGFKEDPDASDVTDALNTKLGSLAQELGICIIAVHHAGKSKEAGEHGSYAWRGSVESSVEIDATRDNVGHIQKRRLIVRKSRDGGNEGWNRLFALQTIQLGIDEDGEPIESAVVMPVDPVAARAASEARAARQVRGTPLRAGARRIIEALEAAIEQRGQDIELDDGTVIRAVSHDSLKAAYTSANEGEPATIDRNFRRDLQCATTGFDIVAAERDGANMYWVRGHANDNVEALA